VVVADPDPLNTFNHQLLDGPIGAGESSVLLNVLKTLTHFQRRSPFS
jgi:hypothetical protein